MRRSIASPTAISTRRLEQAKEAEAGYAKGRKPRALEGVPLAVKDAQRVKGKRTTHGSLIFKDNVDDHSDPMIERLTKAGAIIFARTTTPEFCLSGVCHSRLWGNTRNPWNTDYGPGGSSGGSGAALAAGARDAGDGDRYRRLDPHSGIGLRHRRLQAAAWAQSGRAARQFRPLQSLRADDAQRRRCGADAECDCGPA